MMVNAILEKRGRSEERRESVEAALALVLTLDSSRLDSFPLERISFPLLRAGGEDRGEMWLCGCELEDPG